VCDEINEGKHDDEFPLHIWQTGSGTHTNMNLNEVIANICNQRLTGKLGTKSPIHPNDHVNMSQSSNDSFITVAHISVASLLKKELVPNLKYMIEGFKKKQKEFKDIVKLGRTHFEDAVPMTFGQEFSGYTKILENSLEQIEVSTRHIYELASGGTAVGTGINTNHLFGKTVASEVTNELGIKFITAPNKFEVMSSHNTVLVASDALKLLATNIMKISNDLRFMGSGPRGGIHELLLPENEAGSSIMPGKVNPTQCEAAAMVSIQVMSNNLALTIANSQGYLELNLYNPIILYNIFQSINILKDVCINFTKFCILGLKVNKPIVKGYLDNALTLATALNKYIGYDKATNLSHYAFNHNMSLREANKILNYLPDDKLVEYLDPSKMV